MPRILYNPETAALITWPRQDDEDVVGLQPPVVMLTIEQAEPPTDYDPTAYGLAPTQDVDLDALVLRKGWELVALPPPPPVVPAPRWVQFAEQLAADAAVNGLVATCAATAPVLHLMLGVGLGQALLWAAEAANPVLREMLGVGLGQAAQGDPTTFMAAWGDVVAAGLVSTELAAQMAALAGGFDLPAEFVEGLG
jgi:hypothetical protein